MPVMMVQRKADMSNEVCEDPYLDMDERRSPGRKQADSARRTQAEWHGDRAMAVK